MQSLQSTNVPRTEKLRKPAHPWPTTLGDEPVELTEAGAEEVARMQRARAESAERVPVNTVAEVVRAKRFELVNDAGQVRGELSCGRSGNPHLILWSADHHASVELSLIENVELDGQDAPLPMLGFMAGGSVRMMIGLECDGSPSVDVMDADGHCVMSLGHPAARR